MSLTACNYDIEWSETELQQNVIFHYNDVTMGAIASQITSLTIVYSIVYSDADQRNIKAPRHWPLYGEFTGDRWIPRTNGQLRGKCFHLMTSSSSDIRDPVTEELVEVGNSPAGQTDKARHLLWILDDVSEEAPNYTVSRNLLEMW